MNSERKPDTGWLVSLLFLPSFKKKLKLLARSQLKENSNNYAWRKQSLLNRAFLWWVWLRFWTPSPSVTTLSPQYFLWAK